MLLLKNPDMFGFDLRVENDYASINIMVDPQNFELRTYKRTPFASLMIKNKDIAEELKSYEAFPNEHHEDITKVIESAFQGNRMYQYNLYSTDEDDEYDTLTSSVIFPYRKYHTMLYYTEAEHLKEDDIYKERTIMIGGFPVRGIITPIKRSNEFYLYNACFVSTKPFKYYEDEWNQYYNKVVYVLVDIRSTFSFHEYDWMANAEIGMMYNHIYTLKYGDDAKTQTIEENAIRSEVPYHGRNDLFSKPEKNLFFLSDVPKDIMTKRDTLSVKIGS